MIIKGPFACSDPGNPESRFQEKEKYSLSHFNLIAVLDAGKKQRVGHSSAISTQSSESQTTETSSAGLFYKFKFSVVCTISSSMDPHVFSLRCQKEPNLVQREYANAPQ